MIKRFLQRFTSQETNPPVIIVSGLPRSGTSMMMKILEAGGLPVLTDNIRTADDDNPEGYYEFERVKKLPKGDVAWLDEATGKVVKVLAILLFNLPEGYNYRVVFMRRAMPEILASQRTMLINRGEDPDKMDDEALAVLFEKYFRQAKAWMKQQPHVEYIEVDYNTLLENPLPQIEAINRFFNGKLDQDAMLHVVDPQLYRQRR